MPPTLKDVAKLAGVATNTASSILTGRKDSWASAKTRERVVTVARNLGYTGNRYARGLRTGRYNTIGLILPDLLNPIYVSFARHIEDLLQGSGYNVLIEDVKADSHLEKTVISKLFTSEVDGVIGFLLDREAHTAIFTGGGVKKPAVFLGADFPNTHIDNVSVDFHKGTTEAIEYLYELGHRRIGFVCGLPQASSEDARVNYYTDVLKVHNLTFDKQNFIRCTHTIESAHAAFSAYLAGTPPDRRVTAIFAINDLVAIGSMRAAIDHGLRVPDDLSVIGVDDIPLARFLPCALTTVAYPVREMATKAVEFLIERINAKRQCKRRLIMFPTHLVKRASTAAIRV
jgi:LacI family transcriptional regulator